MAVLSIREFIGAYNIQFSGGEPFVKKGFVELVQFCHQKGIDWGVITNGSAFSRAVVKAVVDSSPSNIDISVDASSALIHDQVRGTPGSLAKITDGIGLLLEERKASRRRFPIRIKSTAHLRNCRHLPRLVE